MRGLAGGDGVEARGEAREDVEELLRFGDGAGKVVDQVDELAAPAIVFRAGFVVGADEGLELGVAAAADVGGGGELGVLADAAASELADGEAVAQRLLKADFDLVVVE